MRRAGRHGHGFVDGRARIADSSRGCSPSASGARAVHSAGRADLSRRDHYMERASGDPDDESRRGRRRRSRDQPDVDPSRISHSRRAESRAREPVACRFARDRKTGDRVSAKVAIAESAITLPRGRLSDYFELTKPRVVLMVLVTTLAGFYLGGRTGFDVTLALNLLAGTALAAGGTLALNEYVERDTDAMMDRTRHRPLPDMRMRPAEALMFGVIATAGGLAYLVLATNILCAAVTAAITVIYLGAYTPLKRYTWMCNLVGAVPGALPPVAGWAAARGGLSWEPAVLFAIMFLWQLPHTFAVARLYRTDYARAGIHLLPQDNSRGGNASNPIVIAGSLGLVAVGIIPTILGFTGIPYAVIASALGVWMLAFGVSMVRAQGNSKAARRLLLASIVYLPIVLLVLVLDRM